MKFIDDHISEACGRSRVVVWRAVRQSDFIGCRSAASPDVAATVNGRPIYYADVDKAYKTQFPARAEGENEDQVQLRRLEVLRSLIDNELMLQRAEKAGLVATDADVDARLNELKAPYTKEEFDKQLKDVGPDARRAQGAGTARTRA